MPVGPLPIPTHILTYPPTHLLPTRRLDPRALLGAVRIVVLAADVELAALLGGEDLIHLVARGCAERIERRLDRAEDRVVLAVTCVEQGVHRAPLRGRHAKVVVHRLPLLSDGHVVVAEDAVGGEPD